MFKTSFGMRLIVILAVCLLALVTVAQAQSNNLAGGFTWNDITFSADYLHSFRTGDSFWAGKASIEFAQIKPRWSSVPFGFNFDVIGYPTATGAPQLGFGASMTIKGQTLTAGLGAGWSSTEGWCASFSVCPVRF